MGYRIGTQTRGRQSVLTLHDDATGASAAILPVARLQPVRPPPARGGRGPSRPRRCRGFRRESAGRGGPWDSDPLPLPQSGGRGQVQLPGRTYKLPANNGPNSIHGFAVDVPWEVVEHKAGADAAFIVGRYQISRNTPQMLHASWPTDAALEVRYALAGGG